eukprot:26948_3
MMMDAIDPTMAPDKWGIIRTDSPRYTYMCDEMSTTRQDIKDTVADVAGPFVQETDDARATPADMTYRRTRSTSNVVAALFPGSSTSPSAAGLGSLSSSASSCSVESGAGTVMDIIDAVASPMNVLTTTVWFAALWLITLDGNMTYRKPRPTISFLV